MTAENPTLLDRAVTTPMRDLVRGRMTGRLSVRALAARSGLPPELRRLVVRVTRRTRLWRLEKSEVARELIAHFREGLERKEPAESLRNSFGDPVTAARLIRRAKKRARPLAWRVSIVILKGIVGVIAAAIVLYLALTVRYYSGEPRIERNFTAEYNERIERVPAEDRAWPIYLRAIELEHPPSEAVLRQERAGDAIEPGDDLWPEIEAYLDRNTEVLALVREAAARPVMGRPLSDRQERQILDRQHRFDLVLQPEAPAPEYPEGESAENPFLITVLLPHLGVLRHYARSLLVADTERAVANADADRVVANIAAEIGMAGQCMDEPFLINELVGLAILSLAAEQVNSVLEEHAGLLTDAHLAVLAHRLSSFAGGGRITVSLAGERMFFEDVVQRMYTDDGTGDGYLTAKGTALMVGLTDLDSGATLPLDPITGPIASGVIAGRKEMMAEYNRVMDANVALSETPLWEREEAYAASELARFERRLGQLTYRVRYLPIAVLMPALQTVSRVSEQATQRRDATLAAIALELYRRRHGSYPATLEGLVPQLLPSVPPDRFTGGPLGYRLDDSGRPVLYSAGVDRVDDGGVPPPGSAGNTEASRWRTTAEVETLRDSGRRGGLDFFGDWVLFPPLQYDDEGNLLPRG